MPLELTRECVGCHIGNVFIGALAYADDVTLLAPTASALRRLFVVHVCGNYASKYKVTFNVAKSECILIGYKRRQSLLTLMLIMLLNRLIVGLIIYCKFTDDDDILNRRCAMFGQINRVICNFNLSQLRFKV